MTTIVCKRCSGIVPKSETRQSSLYGGRICKKCDHFIGQLLSSYQPMGERNAMRKASLKHTVRDEKKQGLFSRIAQKLFRRRGVR
jgi:hypothetical protein